MELLDNIFSSKTRASIIRLLFEGSRREFYMREIQRRTELPIRSIQVELQNLESLDLIRSRRDGNRLYFAANTAHPVCSDLESLVFKSSQWLEKLRRILADEEVEVAFVFGSVARREEKATSDIDLLVVGGIGLRKLSAIVRPIGREIEREINPHVLSRVEFVARLKKKDHFLLQVLDSKKTFLKGGEDELKNLGG